MEIGTDPTTITIEPVEEPVPDREPAPTPDPVPVEEPEKVPA